jgi:hypothetical protein
MASTYIRLPVAIVDVDNFPVSVEIQNDAGNPIPVSAINFDIRDLDFAFDKVDVTGSEVDSVQSGFWDIRDVTGTVSLPTGASTLAEQQTQTASLSVMDDWDEADRAKVNLIVGQAGVQGASGTVSANTQRVVLATDVPLPVGSNTIGSVTQATASNFNAQVVGNVASNAADSGNPVKTAAVYNAIAPTVTDGARHNLQCDVKGNLYVNTDGRGATYSASILNLSTVSGATDIFTITGSNTKVIRVRKLVFQGSSNANNVANISVIKRSTANTGGTSSVQTAVPLDSLDAAATAVVTAYTANPTVGAAVGVITNRKVFLNGSNSNSAEAFIWEYTHSDVSCLFILKINLFDAWIRLHYT